MMLFIKNNESHPFLIELAKAVSSVDNEYKIVVSDKTFDDNIKNDQIVFVKSGKYISFSDLCKGDGRLIDHIKSIVKIYFKGSKEKDFSLLPYIHIVESVEVANTIITEFNSLMEQKEKIDFISISPKYKLEDVVLNGEVKEDILSALSIIKHRDKIYDNWGFSTVDPKPKLILNFFGLPGTGKTMGAHGVAHALGMKILLINYSEIESKYVGDAPKNLMKAFKEAKDTGSLLFFDEADSFLGKRIENVSSSSDQSVNSLRSQMLILLEEFEGVVIFATNLVNNYDKAFESRILKHIKFELPDLINRSIIISKMIPDKAPVIYENKSVLLDRLSKETDSFSGREIRNFILESLTLAAYDELDEIHESYFEKGLNKYKQRRVQLEKENNSKKIPPHFKAKIEEKIKNNINNK